MPRHEHYQEICAAASIGQASSNELGELNAHLKTCEECRARYSDFMDLQSSQYASRTGELEISAPEVLNCVDSPLFRKRFMERAQSEGITFSQVELQQTETVPPVRLRPARRWSWFAMEVAAALVFVSLGILVGHYFSARGSTPSHVSETPTNAQAIVPTPNAQGLIAKISELQTENQDLIASLNTARANLARASSRVTEVEESKAKSDEERARLANDLKERDNAIANLEQQVNQTRSALADVRADLENARGSTAQNQTALVESRIRVQELTEQLADESKALERQKDLLTAGRDIRELMAARNLHIFDVFDTDPKGKTRPAFGRIFLTEGKSLIFYAYDLSDIRVQDAGYHYRVWGKREGQNQRARSLGIFYSDDKAQKRWIFQYDDPKVLNEIDSVFVTLEPPNTNSNQPKGDKLLYAYLKGQANHP